MHSPSKHALQATCLLLVLLLTSSAFAGTHKRGPYTLENNAYSDQTVQVGGPTWIENSPGWVDPYGYHCPAPPMSAMLVEGVPDYPFEILGFVSLRSDIVIEVSFLNNTALNLSGPDIVIFQLDEFCPGAQSRTNGGYMVAVPENNGYSEFISYPKELAVASGALAYGGCGTGVCLGTYELSSIAIDLSDFGVAEGEAIKSVKFYTLDEADPVAIAALHSGAPLAVEPVTWGKIKSMYR
jgi:hypothetical protein